MNKALETFLGSLGVSIGKLEHSLESLRGMLGAPRGRHALPQNLEIVALDGSLVWHDTRIT